MALLDDKALGRAGDRIANPFIFEALAHARLGDTILSEKGKDGGGRIVARRVWIADPLDGTRDCGEWRADLGTPTSTSAASTAAPCFTTYQILAPRISSSGEENWPDQFWIWIGPRHTDEHAALGRKVKEV